MEKRGQPEKSDSESIVETQIFLFHSVLLLISLKWLLLSRQQSRTQVKIMERSKKRETKEEEENRKKRETLLNVGSAPGRAVIRLIPP